jgi:hypothetical protein
MQSRDDGREVGRSRVGLLPTVLRRGRAAHGAALAADLVAMAHRVSAVGAARLPRPNPMARLGRMTFPHEIQPPFRILNTDRKPARRSTWTPVSPSVRTGPAGGINNSGGRCVAGAASENLKLACISVSGMRRSPAQVRVLATYGAGHTIVEAEHSTAGSQHRRCALRGARASTAITTGVRRAISGTLLIETAHFFYSSTLCSACPKARYGPRAQA